MPILSIPLLSIATIMIVDLRFKYTNGWKYYMRVYAIILGWCILLDYAQVEANLYNDQMKFYNELHSEISHIREFDYFGLTLNDQQRQNFNILMNHHLQEGQRCFREAEGMCTLIPDFDSKDVATYLFSQALILSINSSFDAIIINLEAQLVEYGIHQFNQWKKMQTKLRESKSHFEMMNFYKDLLEKQVFN